MENGGKTTIQASKFLLKAILQAIFAFGMRCFKLPVGICKDIAQGDDSYTLVRLIGKL